MQYLEATTTAIVQTKSEKRSIMASEMDIQYLPGVGPKRSELLHKELGVSTVGELLRIYPFRYIDKSRLVNKKYK